MMRGSQKMKKMLVYALSLALAIMSLSCGALAEETWSCPSCGKEDNSSRFCSECGAARPAQDWICPGCGRTNQKLFCPDCGTNRDAAQQQDALMPLETLRPEDDAVTQTDDVQAADVQPDDVQPDVVQPEDVQESDGPLLTLDDLMIPNQLIDLMNACIVWACDQAAAADASVDPSALLDACILTYYDSYTYFYAFGNQEWSAEMYFYYPGVAEPDPQDEASQWCVAVRGTDDYSIVMRSVLFSALLTMLQQADPDMDYDAAVDLMLQGIPGSQYFGNGYTLTYMVTDGGNSIQVMVQKS